MQNYYFRADKLSVGYNKIPLIKEIQIELPKGEILTLIGPNGAGKSTVLKSIARQLEVISGTAYLGKEALTQMKSEELSKKMSVVFTKRLQGEMMTCEEVVATGRYPYTGKFGILSKEDMQITREVMELVYIKDIRNHEFTKVSDGQRQRVMLARAICQEPEILILDEPTSYLDVKYKLEFLSILQEMQRQRGLTVIMSLHELELAKQISDKILCLKGEYVEKFGTPKEVFKKEYIRQFFDISVGSFDEENGTMELEPPKGEAKTFVIAGGGSGREVYHSLQRQGTAFVTGILYENDLDYPVAKALAKEVLMAEAFEPIKESLIECAKKKLDVCDSVICCKETFGTFEKTNEELLAYARQQGKKIQAV